MKTSTVLASLAVAMGAAARNVTLGVVDVNFHKANINSRHSGAGFNYFFVGSETGYPDLYDLNDDGVATLNIDSQYPYNVGVLGNYFAVGPLITPVKLEVADGAIDNYQFWACLNTNDPYNYSTKDRVILVNEKGNSTAPSSECISVKILVEDQ